MHGKKDPEQQRNHLSYLIHIHTFTNTFKYISPLTNTINV